jgi:hypothetical protein
MSFGKNLEGDVAIQLRIAGAVHLAYATAANQRQNFRGAEVGASGQGHESRPIVATVPLNAKGNRSSCHPLLSQRLPADQRTPKRQKRLVDVGPLLVADAEPSKLIEPDVRSTTQRQVPKPLPCLVRRTANSGRIPRLRNPHRIAFAS